MLFPSRSFERGLQRLADHPGFATERGGPRGWEPLHYVCHTSVGTRSDAGEAGLVAIASQPISLGADPNLRYPWLAQTFFDGADRSSVVRKESMRRRAMTNSL